MDRSLGRPADSRLLRSTTPTAHPQGLRTSARCRHVAAVRSSCGCLARAADAEGAARVYGTAPSVRCRWFRTQRVSASSNDQRSLDGGLGAGLLELRPGGLGGLLRRLLQDRLRSGVDQVLGLLQAQTGDDLANGLDDLDLLLAGRLEDDVELVLLLSSLDRCSGTGAGRAGNGDRSGGGDAEGLFELLHELGQLDEGELLERV